MLTALKLCKESDDCCVVGTAADISLSACEMDDRIQVAFQTRMGEQVVRMTSTLVETVSINYEDFNESFLTCGTCLCTYDGGEHTPKLLHCSHTVCLHCLGRIAAAAAPAQPILTTSASPSTSSTSSSGTLPREPTFRCPICRELITVPRGGVAALPPSFLVNQLLDLMASQRREVIPKCSTHTNQELLFCENCDSVFCAACKTSPHSTSQSGSHNVIPFAVAIKRMSEILLYKANECMSKLDEAADCISEEIRRLGDAEDNARDVAEQAFEEAVHLLQKRKQQYFSKIKEIADDKREKLNEQLELIDKEKAKVRDSCDGLEYQVEVRHITKRISELSSQLDSFASLRHPRENAYILCKTVSDLTSLETAVSTDIHTSTTYPPLCSLKLQSGSILSKGIEIEVILETRDYHNDVKKLGGDPVSVKVTDPNGTLLNASKVSLSDNDDGTYTILFTPTEVGQYTIQAKIFGRTIRDEKFQIEISAHNDPIRVWGKGELCQPVSIGRNDQGELFILDTGNARVVVLDKLFNLIRVLENETLKGRSCTGIAYSVTTESLLIVNWRTKEVTSASTIDGSTLSSFTYGGFVEPIGISVDRKGNIYVADNGAKSIFAFDTEGKFKYSIQRDSFGLLGGVAVSPDDKTVVVADTSLFVISGVGSSQEQNREIKVPGKGRFGGVVVDSQGVIVATRTEKNRSFLQVFVDNKLASTIDSFNYKLRRPSDVAFSSPNHILVIDLGNDCVKQYRYK